MVNCKRSTPSHCSQGQNLYHRLYSTKHGSARYGNPNANLNAKNKSFGLWLAAVVTGMCGLSYAAVPMYRVFCQVTGFGGTTRREGEGFGGFLTSLKNTKPVEGTQVTVVFTGDTAKMLPWKFTPLQRNVTVRPGETALAFYEAENFSEDAVTGIATYNVNPPQAAPYFNKVQCFCFDEQRLKPGEKIDMPVFFFLDPEFVDDPRMKDVKKIVLSYTFFRAQDVSPEQLQKAQAAAMGFH